MTKEIEGGNKGIVGDPNIYDFPGQSPKRRSTSGKTVYRERNGKKTTVDSNHTVVPEKWHLDD